MSGGTCCCHRSSHFARRWLGRHSKRHQWAEGGGKAKEVQVNLSLTKRNRLRRQASPGPESTSESRGSSPYFVLTTNGKPIELVARARADGRENLPESEAQEPNEVETSILREHDRQHVELVEHTRNQ